MSEEMAAERVAALTLPPRSTDCPASVIVLWSSLLALKVLAAVSAAPSSAVTRVLIPETVLLSVVTSVLSAYALLNESVPAVDSVKSSERSTICSRSLTVVDSVDTIASSVPSAEVVA